MKYDRENVFARIIRREAPAHRVFEDASTLAFMDLMPQADGHTLVVPKVEAVSLLDVDPAILAQTIQTTQRIARAVKAAFDAHGIMIAQLNGAAAGQTVFHLHFHVVPRYDGADFEVHAQKVAPADRLAAHAERVRAALAALEG